MGLDWYDVSQFERSESADDPPVLGASLVSQAQPTTFLAAWMTENSQVALLPTTLPKTAFMFTP